MKSQNCTVKLGPSIQTHAPSEHLCKIEFRRRFTNVLISRFFNFSKCKLIQAVLTTKPNVTFIYLMLLTKATYKNHSCIHPCGENNTKTEKKSFFHFLMSQSAVWIWVVTLQHVYCFCWCQWGACLTIVELANSCVFIFSLEWYMARQFNI